MAGRRHVDGIPTVQGSPVTALTAATNTAGSVMRTEAPAQNAASDATSIIALEAVGKKRCFANPRQISVQRDELEAQAEALKEARRRKDEFLITLTHISQHKHARSQQDVLLREINHRIKNLFSVTAGLISLSAQGSTSVRMARAKPKLPAQEANRNGNGYRTGR